MKPTAAAALGRGLRKRCPRCGRGAMFKTWYTMRDQCPSCGMEFEPAGSDTYAFSYIGSATVTGLFLLLVVFVEPPQSAWGRAAALAAALALLFLTMPRRKGLFIAIDYLARRASGDPAAPGEPGDAAKPEG